MSFLLNLDPVFFLERLRMANNQYKQLNSRSFQMKSSITSQGSNLISFSLQSFLSLLALSGKAFLWIKIKILFQCFSFKDYLASDCHHNVMWSESLGLLPRSGSPVALIYWGEREAWITLDKSWLLKNIREHGPALSGDTFLNWDKVKLSQWDQTNLHQTSSLQFKDKEQARSWLSTPQSPALFYFSHKFMEITEGRQKAHHLCHKV